MKKNIGFFLFLLLIYSWSFAGIPTLVSVFPPCIQPDTPALSSTSDTICYGSNVTISVSSLNNLNDATAWYLYANSCGNNFISSSATGTFIVQPDSSTTYFVRGEGGCVVPGICDSIVITVNLIPQVIANATDTVICQGDSIALYGSGATNYSWDNGIINNLFFIPLASATYSVTGTSAGCSATDMIQITVNPRPLAPTILTNNPPHLCTGDSVELSIVSTPGFSYSWYNTTPDTGWQQVGEMQTIKFSNSEIDFSPLSDEPYIVFADFNLNYKLHAQKFNGIQWHDVGTPGFSSISAIGADFAIHPITSEPYVAYPENGLNNRLSVKKYNGATWEYVGGEGFSLGGVSSWSLAFDPQNNQPTVAYAGATNNYLPKVSVVQFNGVFWEPIGSYGISYGAASDVCLAFNPATSEPYVIYCEISSSSINFIKKFNGTTWQDVVNPSQGITYALLNQIAFQPGTNDLFIVYQSSRQGEFHPKPLTEPYLIVSHHTALQLIVSG